MVYAGTQKFNKRLSRIEAQRHAMKKGVIYSVNHDGLIVARPRRVGMRRPLHLIFVALAGVMLFKAALYATLGASSYEARVAKMAEGTVVEQAGAWVMTADQATIWIATQINLAF